LPALQSSSYFIPLIDKKIVLMRYLLLFLVLICSTSSCGLRERELELDKKMQAINQKEQELLLKEKSLQLKEEELAKKAKLLDSSAKIAADSFFTSHPNLPGKWNVTMRCIETTCSGSAVGDTKNEQWDISYQNNGIVAQAFSNNNLVRVYSGNTDGTAVELATEPDNADPSRATKMIVRLQDIKENEIQGQREIIRPDNCHIVYALNLKKQ
jgi:hypothetical protein